jgi:UDP-glucose 4-epimerase
MLYLVTGGLGYVGGHLVNQLLKLNHEVIILDNSTTHPAVSKKQGVLTVEGSITDLDTFSKVGKIGHIDGVFHTAAKKSISESITNPELYFQVNKVGTENVMNFCKANNIKNVVFTSSAAVYGELDSILPIEEHAITRPINPYGESKLQAEASLRFESIQQVLSAISLRCFNIVGTSNPQLLDKRGDNVLPILIRTLLLGDTFIVNGGKHKTPDGTCIRDYINVSDVIQAHILAMKYLEQTSLGFYASVNVGTGEGFSVLQLIDSLKSHSNLNLKWNYGEHRKGDPANVVCDNKLARNLLGWVPSIGLNQSVKETLSAFEDFVQLN